MTSKELIYVKTVADEKSISRAARKLFMAQPSLSQSIQRIEESLGTALFHRTTGGLTLTFAGERYYHRADPCGHHQSSGNPDTCPDPAGIQTALSPYRDLHS